MPARNRVPACNRTQAYCAIFSGTVAHRAFGALFVTL